MKKIIFTISCAAIVLFLLDSSVLAMGCRWRVPFGGYCTGPEWGWYGAGMAVKSVEEARKIVQAYYSKDDIKIGGIRDLEYFYEVEIKDRKGALIDVIIVDKRTGRIRTIN